MDHHPGRLVDDYEVTVFIHDVERYRLGLGNGRVSLRNLELDLVAGRDAVRGTRRAAVEGDEMALDQTRRGGTAQVMPMLGEEAVEPWRRLGGDQLVGLRKTYAAMISTTPMDTAESATLNTGQKWKLIQSVTVPLTSLS